MGDLRAAILGEKGRVLVRKASGKTPVHYDTKTNVTWSPNPTDRLIPVHWSSKGIRNKCSLTCWFPMLPNVLSKMKTLVILVF